MPNFVVPWDLRHHPALRDEDIAEILGDLNASRLSAALAAIARTAIFELQWDDDLATDVIEVILRHPKGERAGQVSARLQEIAADLEDEARGTRWGVVAGADGWEKADRLSRQAELVRLFGSLVEADDIDQAYAAVMPSVLDSVVRKQQARVIVLVNCVRHIATRGG